MYLLWLRVAAILYAAGCVAVFPAVLNNSLPWRKSCVHLGGLAFFFHFVSVVEMLVVRPIAGCRWACAKLSRCSALPLLGSSSLSGGFTTPSHWESLRCRPPSSWSSFPRWGRIAIRFPSEGVRISWLVAHIIALLLRLCRLVLQPAGLACSTSCRSAASKPSPSPAKTSGWAPLDWLPPARHAGAHRPRHARIRLSLHDRRPDHRLCAGAGNLSRRGLLPSIPRSLPRLPCGSSTSLLLLVRRGAGLRGRKAAYLSGAVLVVMMAVWAANLFSHVHRFGPQ